MENQSEEILVKNMVCDRCIMAVESVLKGLNISYSNIELGKISTEDLIADTEKEKLKSALENLGFSLILDKNQRLIEQIKSVIIRLVREENAQLNLPLSQLLQDELHQEYSGLSLLFSQSQGQTIEKYFIAQKIERVKELLSYNELSLSEIADLLHYSSVAYLSNQFKKQTGITPSSFKNNQQKSRQSLDSVS